MVTPNATQTDFCRISNIVDELQQINSEYVTQSDIDMLEECKRTLHEITTLELYLDLE